MAMYAFDNGSMVGSGEALQLPGRTFPPQPAERSSFGARRGPNWVAIIAIAAFHVAALIALAKMDVIHIAKPRPEPLVVNLLAEPPAPPPAAPKPARVPVTKIQPTVVAPAPIVPVVTIAPPVIVTTPVPAPRAVIVAAPVVTVTAVPVAANLDENLIAGNPPKYPIESLRKKEQGTVVLRLTVGTGGTVTDISIAQSSGSERLDNAALRAVRGWRWRPMMHGGQAVAITGTMPIPFTIKA